MAEILNMTLKKDVFESIVNGTSREILIDRSKWWTKRLTNEIGTFKDFDTVRISCGSPEKLDYHIESIEKTKKNFVIHICEIIAEEDSDFEPQDENEIDETETQQEEIQDEPVVENEEVVEENAEEEEDTEADEAEEKQEQTKPEIVPEPETPAEKPTEKNVENKTENVYSYKDDVMSAIDCFCAMKDVYPVTMEPVRIMRNGTIIGSTKKLVVDGYVESKIDLKTIQIVKTKEMTDEMFIEIVIDELKKIIDGKYVFIRRKSCGFKTIASGEDCLVLRVAGFKKYFLKSARR